MNLKYGKRIKEDIREGLEVSYNPVSREWKKLAEKMKSIFSFPTVNRHSILRDLFEDTGQMVQ